MSNVQRLFDGETKVASAVPLKDGKYLQVKPTRQMFDSQHEWVDAWSKDKTLTLKESVPPAPKCTCPQNDYERIRAAASQSGVRVSDNLSLYGNTIEDAVKNQKAYLEYVKGDFKEEFTHAYWPVVYVPGIYRVQHLYKALQKCPASLTNTVGEYGVQLRNTIVEAKKNLNTFSQYTFDIGVISGIINKLNEDAKKLTIQEWIDVLVKQAQESPEMAKAISAAKRNIEKWEASPYKDMPSGTSFGKSRTFVRTGDTFKHVYTNRYFKNGVFSYYVAVGRKIGKTLAECGVEGEPEFWVVTRGGEMKKVN
jgi:hypothetical protein